MPCDPRHSSDHRHAPWQAAIDLMRLWLSTRPRGLDPEAKPPTRAAIWLAVGEALRRQSRTRPVPDIVEPDTEGGIRWSWVTLAGTSSLTFPADAGSIVAQQSVTPEDHQS